MATTQRAVGRPRSFDENEMLDRALDVFWQRGAAATTTRVLEAELGVTQSSLYNAFGSKQALLDRALDRYVDRMEASVVAPLDAPEAGIADLLAFVDAMMTWISKTGGPGCMLLNLLAEHGTADAALVERARVYRDRIRSACRSVLERLDREAAPGRADLIVSAVLGINIAARGGAPASELENMGDALRGQITAWGSPG